MSQLNLKIQLQAFDRVSKQFENIRKVGRGLGKQFDNNLNELKKLDGQMKAVNSFRKRERELSKLSNNIETAKNKSREFKQLLASAQENNATTKQLQKLSRQYQKSQQNISDLIHKHKQLKSSLGEAGNKLKQAGISSKNLSNTEAQLKSRVDSLNQSLNKQSTQLERVAKRQERLNNVKEKFRHRMGRSQNMAMAGYAGLAVGRKVTGGITSMLRPGISFGEQMSAVQAKLRLDKNSDDYKNIRQQALDLGSSTSFTASEVGAGQEFLAMAGFNANAIKASMGDVLNLAKASATDLATTADITSNIAGAFKIDPAVTGNIEHLADVLAVTTTTANVDLQMLGDTMKYLAQAEGLNLGVEQAAAMAGMLGNVGIQGTMAGTTMRSMLNRLSAPAKAGRDAMDELGVKFADTGDNAKDFVVFLKDIAEKTKAMGSVAKAQYLKDIFGQNAVSGMTELVNQAGTGKLDEYIKIIMKADGAAKKMADTMADNTGGDLKALASAWEGLNIAVTDTEEGPLRKLIQATTKIIRGISNWVKENPKVAGTLLTIVSVLGALIGGMGGLLIIVAGILGPFAMFRLMLSLIGIHSATAASKGGLLIRTFKKLGSAGKRLIRIIFLVGRAFLFNPIGLAVTAIAGLAYLIYRHWDKVGPYFKNLWSNVSNWFVQTWQLLKTDTVAGLLKIGKTILDWSPLGWFYKAFAGVMKYFGFEMPDTLSGFIDNIAAKLAAAISEWDVIGWFKSAFDVAVNWVNNKIDGILKIFVKLKNKIGNLFGGVDSATDTKKYKDYSKGAGGFSPDKVTFKKPLASASKKTNVNVTNHITVKGSDNPRQVASRIAAAVGNAQLYDGVA